MKTYTLHFIRHGMTTGNEEGRYVGHQDLSLSLQGEEELRYLKDTCIYPDPPVVFTSPLKRCTETCNILFPEAKPVVMHELIEYNFGEFEGHTAEELQQYEEFSAWLSGGMDAAPPHGESNAEFGERIRSALESIVDGLMKTGITEAAIVTHGGIISVLMALYCLPEAPTSEWICMNGAGYTVRITPSLWSQTRKFEGVAQIPTIPEETLRELGYLDAEDDEWTDDEDYGFGPDTTGTEHFTL
ncbi:MAG: histidine phosphatase family protein [Bacteroidales bacterium]|nr:histidine phosphatase family protein [Bacteroidales bacterium]